jgi:hypothetical protein
MKKILLTILFSANVFALETDNYLAWEIELEDSSQKINQYLEEQIQIGLSEANAKKDFQSCFDVTKKIASRFKAKFVHDNPVEKWLRLNLEHGQYYPDTMNYVLSSIYRSPYRFYIPKFGLAQNIKVNHIYFGMDKLTHFTWTARNYFLIFIKEIKNQKSESEATQAAIQFGFLDELTLHGFWASGVYSYADLEANYQGLLFYKNFCFSGKDNYLKLNEKEKWELVRLPRIEEYVSPKWDESYNLSYYLPENWTKIAPSLATKYCSLRHAPKVVQRFNYYRNFKPKSFSENYIDSLHKQNNFFTPFDKNQSLKNLCPMN